MTDRIEIADIPTSWQIAVAILWLREVPDTTAECLPPDELAAHFHATLTDRGDNMLSDEIACVRAALEAALEHDNPAMATAMMHGCAARLEDLEAQAFAWEEHAVLLPDQRFGLGSQTGMDASNIVPLRPRTEGDAS